MSNIRHWNPAEGFAFQGDVSIIPVPKGIPISEHDEIKPVAGRLILQEGEVTGHHHAIWSRVAMFRDDAIARTEPVKTADPKLAQHFGAAPEGDNGLDAKPGTEGRARMFRDTAAAEAMVRAGVLERHDLMVGFLRVDGAPVVVRHEEHDAIRVPVGDYYVGRQVESTGAEERRVED